MHTGLSPYVPQTRNTTDLPKVTLRAMAHVQSCAKRYVSRIAPTFHGSPRDGVPSERPCTNDFLNKATSELFTAAYVFTTDALPLSAERIALPSVPGFVNLVDVVPPEIAKIYSEPNPDLFRPLEEQLPAPKVHLVDSPADWASIIRRMHQIGMVRFVRDPKSVQGAFGAPKSDGSIRLIVDGRPAKAIFIPCPSMELPSPDLLSRLEVPAGETLYVAKADLDNYFHRIRNPDWLHEYLALPPVRAGDVGLGDEFGDATMIHPCCTTLPMGWSHSAYLAQVAHVHLVVTRTSMKAADRITRANDFKVDRTRHTIYMDDMG